MRAHRDRDERRGSSLRVASMTPDGLRTATAQPDGCPHHHTLDDGLAPDGLRWIPTHRRSADRGGGGGSGLFGGGLRRGVAAGGTGEGRLPVPLLEPLDSSTAVHQLLAAGEEGVALVAQFDVHLRLPLVERVVKVFPQEQITLVSM